MVKSELKVRVSESLAQDEVGWFWLTALTITGAGEETLHLRSPEYFTSRDEASKNLENARPQIFDKINESLQEIGLFIDQPRETKLH